ncbi:uncharacterized protein ISCGN_020374 [Ixodes scapularis]
MTTQPGEAPSSPNSSLVDEEVMTHQPGEGATQLVYNAATVVPAEEQGALNTDFSKTTRASSALPLRRAIRSDLESLLNEMLAATNGDDASSKVAKKTGKRKGSTLEDRVLQRLRLEFLKETSRPDGEGPASASGGTEDSADEGEAEARAAAAEASSAKAEAKAAEAERRAAQAEERAAQLEKNLEDLQAQLYDSEARAVAAEGKALFAVNTLFPLLEGLPGIVDKMLTGVAAGATAANNGPAETLKFGNTLLPAIRMVRLQNAGPSIFTQELAEMVFGQTTLGTQSLRGSTFGEGKEPLHKETVDDIVVYVMNKFPGECEGNIRRYLRRKCNNAASSLKKKPAYF